MMMGAQEAWASPVDVRYGICPIGKMCHWYILKSRGFS